MNERTVVNVSSAPPAIGPYSQAVKCGDLLFVSGQLPIDRKTGELVGSDAAAQTRKALENLKAILEACEFGLPRVAKTTVFLTDLNDFPAMNKVYAEFFAFEPPARSTIQVAALPKGAKVEIEAIAVFPKPQRPAASGALL